MCLTPHGGQSRLEISAGLKGRSCHAEAFFEDSLLERGWGIFEVKTYPSGSDDQQTFAAGFLEGYLTGTRIAQNFANMWQFYFGKHNAGMVGGPLPEPYHSWLRKQYGHAHLAISGGASSKHATVAAHQQNQTLAFWRQARMVMHQFDGAVAGFDAFISGGGVSGAPCHAQDKSASLAAEARLLIGGASSWEVLTLLNAVGDMIDLKAVLENSTAPMSGDKHKLKTFLFEKSMCSAIFKVLPDYSDIFMGHSAWFTYSATNRIYKHYHLNTSPEITAAPTVSFSSYSGYLYSLDDFYLMSSGLVMIQTSLGVIDPDRHRRINQHGLLAWHRVRIANALARSGQEWYEYLRRENSGTYNNEYMVLNTNRFIPGQPPSHGLLWVVEQIPDLVEGRDVTSMLEYGYFPSYNIPYFDTVWEAAGYKTAFEKTGDVGLTHIMAPRAQLFRRDQGKTRSLDDVRLLLRSNNYLHDALSAGNPINALCARGDLKPVSSKHTWSPQPYGCYDAKVTSVSLARNLTAVAQSGPPSGGESKLAPFSWGDQFSSVPNNGLPRVYDFPPVVMRPEWWFRDTARVDASRWSPIYT